MTYEARYFIKKNNWLWFFIFIVFLSACPTDASRTRETEETTLTISNNSSYNFNGCRWNGTTYVHFLMMGDKQTESVDPGSGYIYFTVIGDYNKINNKVYGTYQWSGKTNDVVMIEKGGTKTFIFLDTTLVIDDANKICTLLECVNKIGENYLKENYP